MHCSNTLLLLHVEALLWQLAGMYEQQFDIGRVYFCILDTDLIDSEKPSKLHKFSNVKIMVMHFPFSILIKSLFVGYKDQQI